MARIRRQTHGGIRRHELGAARRDRIVSRQHEAHAGARRRAIDRRDHRRVQTRKVCDGRVQIHGQLAQIRLHVAARGDHALEVPAEAEILALSREHDGARAGCLDGEDGVQQFAAELHVDGIRRLWADEGQKRDALADVELDDGSGRVGHGQISCMTKR
jgi:hypothetical protein